MEKVSVILGTDPEMFVSKGGVTVGSESVIGDGAGINNNKVIRDGVQVELNPIPSNCRDVLLENIHQRMTVLDDAVTGKEMIVDSDVTVMLDPEMFNSLSPDSKKFGCEPSYHLYTGDKCTIGLDPEQYMYRSAGGHIHLGMYDARSKSVLDQTDKLVPMLDIILGNTMVLLDRDDGNIW